MVLRMTLAAAMTQAVGFWQLSTHSLATPHGLMALAALALAGMALAFLAHAARIATAVTARPLTGRAAALRTKAWSAVFQRQLNPDAAGHARPRAPSAVPAAA